MNNRIITSEQIENFYRHLCSEERTENTVTKYLRDIAARRMRLLLCDQEEKEPIRS